MNLTLRARWHDYRCHCIYLITLFKSRELPAFSSVAEDASGTAVVRETGYGEMLRRALEDIQKQHRGVVHVINYVIMPDHIHFVFHVKRVTKRVLGDYIAAYKALCTQYVRAFEAEHGLVRKDRVSAFQSGFHDRILTRKGQLQNMIDYVADNPRRLLFKRRNPQYFRQHYLIDVNGATYELLGNIFLLDVPDKLAVKISRRWSEREYAQARYRWLSEGQRGAVLVSPFIHRLEREICEAAMAEEMPLVYIRNVGFQEREAPQGRWFEYCSRGLVLFVTPVAEGYRRDEISRDACMRMNDLARALCEHDLRHLNLRLKS